MIILFLSGLTDKFENIKKELLRCRTDFINLFEEILNEKYDKKTFEVFDPIVDSIHKNLRPKISLVGFSGVGKTTITKLIRAEEIPVQHIPTITGDIATVKIGKLHFHLWDFAGQEQFSYLWNNFIKGSDAVILVTDSTLENVDKSKFFLELIKEQAPYAHTAIIGNKQDLKGALSPVQIENFLGLKAYSMIANDPSNRDKMIKIVADILEMSAEVSPLLKPLLDRDKLIEEATIALKSADFEKAALLFDKISYLCIELGDDSLGKEFFEKSQKILEMLKETEPSQPGLDISKKPIIVEESKKSEIPVIEKKIVSKPQISIKAMEVAQPLLSENSKTEIIQKEIVDDNSRIKEKVEQVQHKDRVLSSKKMEDQDNFLKPQAQVKEEVLKLNPEDFMVKISPKTVGVVPKDAKFKLKTSAYGHVKNLDKKDIETVLNQIQSKEAVKHTLDTKPIADTAKLSQPPSTIKSTEVESLKRELIDLKIRKANLFKMSLDLDMQELEKQITKEKAEEKKEEINKYNKRIDEKILEIEKLLKDLQE
ncbi:MAG: ADP-ribosylation factor-like protein [Candidatus Hodarchaeota archaeon]